MLIVVRCAPSITTGPGGGSRSSMDDMAGTHLEAGKNMSGPETQDVFGVVLFHSVQGALGAEKTLEAAGISYKLIPVPRRLSSNCGFCIRFAWSDQCMIEQLLDKVKLGIEKIGPLPME